jgi:hypothetical protein
MKKITLIISMLFIGALSFAQHAKDDETVVIQCTEFHVTRPLTEIVKDYPVDFDKLHKEEESEDREHRKPQRFKKTVKDGPEYGNDPASLQQEMGTIPGKAPIQNWPGQSASGFRPLDPSGAAGPTHYVQMINSTTFRVYNKSTGATMLTASLGSLWSPATANDGDPIVLYDKAADRWFLAQFNSANKMYIAISQTNNPTGAYYTYTFTSPDFPDYLKFSVWHDGYYMTGNYAQKVFCFERAAMLAGTPTARSIYKTFSPPNAGYFFVPLPGDASDGTLPPAGTPCPIFSYSDNGWGGTYTDAINIYKMAVTWGTTPAATITSAGTVPTAAFDASYDVNWDDVSQPGTTQKLDGIGGVLMYRAQWKTWTGYNSVVLNWAVKISTTQRSIKWCELRQNQSTGVWSMYQEGIYTPDANTRWLGSIAMDNNGSIGLAYLKSNSTSIYPGLYYVGRRTCDPLGTLPVTETVAIAGTGSQTGGVNRDGDYAHMSLDPDGITFWYTGEYMGGTTGSNAARTRIFSFQITPCASTPPVANFTGSPTTICAGQSVTYTDASTNSPTSWAWTFTGGTPSSSTVQNPVVVYSTPGTYSATLTATNSSGSGTPFTRTNYITVNAIPSTPTAIASSPVCSGSTITLSTPTVTGATYAWSGPGGFTSALQNPTRTGATTAMAGTYSVTVTVNGCTSAAGTATVVVNTSPAAPTAGSNSPVCAGSTINLTATTIAGATYSWTGPATFTNATQNPTRPTATTAMAGTYSVTATVSGCTSVAGTTTVVVNAIPSTPVATATSPVCSGSTITLSTPTVTGATYAWSGPSGYTSALQNPTRTGATTAMAGTYSVTVTVNGCTSAAGTATVVVNSAPAPPAAGSNSPVCAGSTINLTATTVAGATYSWTGPATFTNATQNPTRPSATTAMAGTYSVTATVSGCTSVAGTTTVVVNAIPSTPTATATSPVCSGATITLSTPTVSGATYAWSGPGGFTSALQNPTRTGATTAMAGTYSVTVTLNGCTSAAGTTTVVVNPTPTAPTAGNNSPVCAGSTINLTATTVAGATYAWSGPSAYTNATQNPTRPSSTAAMGGTYSVTVTVSGCTSSAATTTVVVNAGPTAQAATVTATACGASTGAITLGATTGGTSPYTYSVNGSAYTSATSYTGLSAGSYPVSVKDANGCIFSTTVTVSNSAGPTATSVTTTNSTCGNSNGGLTIGTVTGGTGPYTYSVNGSAYSTTLSYAGLAAGSYSINVKDANGCIYTTTATIVNSAGPTAQATTTSNSTCGNANGSVSVGATTGGTGPFTYSLNGGAFTTTTNYTGLAAGTYTVTVKDANGCTFTVNAVISNTGTTPPTPTITQSGSVLTSSSATGNQWYLNGTPIPGATNQNYTFTANGNYTVVVTTGGCSSAPSAVTTVTGVGIEEMANNPYNLIVFPNPNDGHFTITFNSSVKDEYRIEIVNSIGQLIFREDIKNFTGTYKKEMSVVEYGQGIYMISLTNSKNETVKKIVVY